MEQKIEEMIEKLKAAENMEQLAEQESRIAEMIGTGFLKNQLDFSYMEKVKTDVERVEAERREQFLQSQSQQKHTTRPAR